MFRFLALVGALLLALAAPAFAQSTIVDGASIFGAWKPYITEIVGIGVAAIIGLLAKLLKDKFGLDIEARHREALQSALTNAAGTVIMKIGDVAGVAHFDAKNAAVAEGVSYVLASVPDALRYFGLTEAKLREMIEAKTGTIIAKANG